MRFTSSLIRDFVKHGHEFSVDEDGLRSAKVWSREPVLGLYELLATKASLAILGEPGIGKTSALQSLAADPDAVFVPLVDITHVQALQDALSPLDPSASDPRTLVLDGLDECPLPLKSLTRHLDQWLNGRSGTRVLIGCRASDWHAPLGDVLKAALGRFEVYEILPLSVGDITQLANERGVDPEGFLEAIRERAVGPLAGIPLTLDLLLRRYAAHGDFPRDARELFEEGLLELADEPDTGRARDRMPAGNRVERLAVAARIAATMLLCARNSVATREHTDTISIDASNLSGGQEPAAAGPIAVTGELLDSTLATAIFTGRGHGRLGVSHASFGSYLTARYLLAHRVPDHQLRALLTRTNPLGRTGIPTQLREVAAWVVAMDAGANEWLFDIDPIGVLAHIRLINEPILRQKVVAYLLENPEVTARLPDRRWRLSYPGLYDQLSGHFRNALDEECGEHLGHPVARRAHTAVTIARASLLSEAVPDIGRLVAQPGLNPVLRSSAAYALTDLDSALAAEIFRSVLTELREIPGNDPDHELLGQALSACWPEHLSITELIDAISIKPRTDFIGSYYRFRSRLIESTPIDKLSGIVDEIARRCEPTQDEASTGAGEIDLRDDHWRELLLKIFGRLIGAENILSLEQQVTWLLVQFAKQKGRIDLDLKSIGTSLENLKNQRELRRRLVQGALAKLSPDEAMMLLLMWRYYRHGLSRPGTPLLDVEDLGWLFDLGMDDHFKEHAERLIRGIFDAWDPAHQQAAWDLRNHPLFESTVAWWFKPIALGSDEAREAAEYARLGKEEPWAGAEDHLESLQSAWGRVANEDHLAFIDLTLGLWVDHSTGSLDYQPGPTERWPSIDLIDFDHDVYVAAARSFVTNHDPTAEGWLPKSRSISYAAVVGYRALLEIQHSSSTGPDKIDLQDKALARWAPLIVTIPRFQVDEEVGSPLALEAEIAQRVPRALTAAVGLAISTAIDDGTDLPSLGLLEGVPTSMVTEMLGPLLSRLIDAALTQSVEGDEGSVATITLGSAMQLLQSSQFQNLIKVAGVLARDRTFEWPFQDPSTPGKQTQTGLLVQVVLAVASCGQPERLSFRAVVGRAIADHEFGVALAAVGPLETTPMSWEHITDSEISEAALWLTRTWGPAPARSGIEGPEDSVRNWRDGLIRQLMDRNTDGALRELGQIQNEFPKIAWINEVVAQAEARQRDSWVGPTPADLHALIAEDQSTIVHDEDDLYRVVSGSLERLQSRLLNVGQLLWNETRPPDPEQPKVWSPKYEPDLSAVIADHLRQDLHQRIVAYREVQVRQTTSKGHGLAVDVLVGNTPDGGNAVSVPIEVKGCWNPKLLTDLKDQLVGDYLPSLTAHRGIYVCGWFDKQQWTDRDSRRRQILTLERSAVQEELERLASEASADPIQVCAMVLDIPRPAPSERAT